MGISDWIAGGSLVVACASLILAFTGPMRRSPKKELSFGVLNRSLLMGAAKSVSPDCELLYKGAKVNRLSAVTLCLMNTGQLDVAKSDFETSLRIELSNVDYVHSVNTLRSEPSYLDVVFEKVGRDVVQISPLLLNSGDFFSLRLVVSHGDRPEAIMRTRIKGVGGIFPLLVGPHPGYEYRDLLLFVAGCLGFGWGGWRVWIDGASRMLALGCFVMSFLSAFAICLVVANALKVKRKRWMGRNTEDLSNTESIT